MAVSRHRTRISLDEVHDLALQVFLANGCDQPNAAALARTVRDAERDGAESHGLFRVPGYVAALRSGKVDGRADPDLDPGKGAVLRLNGGGGFTPLALERGIPALAAAAAEAGVATLSIVNTYHFAALWHETEALAERGLAAVACVNYAAVMTPFGGTRPLLGTNPISFAWPRPGRDPLVFDMATAAMARGEIQIARREGGALPEGAGLGPDGQPTRSPAAVLDGVQLPFGGPKGSALALMVEMLAAGMTGESFSVDARRDVADGGPPRGGEFLIALAPGASAGAAWADHCERFFEAFAADGAARLPGARRHARRKTVRDCRVDTELLEQVRSLR